MINYEYDKEQKVVFVKFSGAIEYREYWNYLYHLLEEKDLPPKLKVLQDFQEGFYDFDYDEAMVSKDTEAFIEKLSDSCRRVRIAFIHNKPKETAISMITQARSLTSEELDVSVFSSRGAAIFWLKENMF